MACRLFGDKPLSEPMTIYYPLDTKEKHAMKIWWQSDDNETLLILEN